MSGSPSEPPHHQTERSSAFAQASDTTAPPVPPVPEVAPHSFVGTERQPAPPLSAASTVPCESECRGQEDVRAPTPTTCCSCTVSMRGPECAYSKDEGAGCDPRASFMTDTDAGRRSSDFAECDSLAVGGRSRHVAAAEPGTSRQNTDETSCTADVEMPVDGTGFVEASDTTVADRRAPTTTTASPTTAISTGLTDENTDDDGKGDTRETDRHQTKVKPPSEIVQQARAAGKAEQASLTLAEKEAARKARRERTRKAKMEQNELKSSGRRNRGRRGSGGGRRKNRGSGRMRESPEKHADKRDPFDEWLGRRLKAWCDGVVFEEGSEPPEECGTAAAEIDFDLNEDEIAFPASLSALQRRHVHGWAMQLALFHASSGEDTERHVIVSKTGEFQGKLLTRGGRVWYKEGVKSPAVKRFALQEGSDEVAEPLIAALKSFVESISKLDKGFTRWLAASGHGLLDGSDLAEARAALATWPTLQDTEWEYVDTPDRLSSLLRELEACKEFGFDVEAHNFRTFHGLTCLLQVSTSDKDYVVDPLAKEMWESMATLRGVFANPDILKIGHSIRSCDVPSLFRDFGIVIVNAIDTEEAARALGDKHSGLATVLENAGVKELHDISGLKTIMQACDWRERPLAPEQLLYARCDSHYLVPLWRLMRTRLLAEDTEANRADAREEKELKALERRLKSLENRLEGRQDNKKIGDNRRFYGDKTAEQHGDARSNEKVPSEVEDTNGDKEAHLDHDDDNDDDDEPPSADLGGGHAVFSSPISPRNASSRGFGRDEKALEAKGAGVAGGGEESPQLYAQEPWPSQWESPEICHRQQRSRSGSFLRSELGSINESEWNDLTGFGGGVGSKKNVPESDFSAAFEEAAEEEEEEEEEGEASAMESGGHQGAMENHGDLSSNGFPFALGYNFVGDVEGNGMLSDDAGQDEDEDLWEGWGEQEADVGAPGAEGETSEMPNVAHLGMDNVATRSASDDATAPPPVSFGPAALQDPDTSIGEATVVNDAPAAVAESIVAEDGTAREDHSADRREAAAEYRSASGRDEVVLSPRDHTLHTDGVRLLWKALTRTQVAAAVLWQPAPEANREGAHNERHFRTAVQRLTSPRWSEVNVRVYEEIYLWRDRTARRLDDGTAYVCPGDILIDVALTLPTTLSALRRVSAPLSPVLGNGDTPEAVELVEVVKVALGLPEEEGGGQDEVVQRR